MAKRKIPRLTPEEIAASDESLRLARARIAERRALEAAWEEAQARKRSFWPFRRWSRGQARA